MPYPLYDFITSKELRMCHGIKRYEEKKSIPAWPGALKD